MHRSFLSTTIVVLLCSTALLGMARAQTPATNAGNFNYRADKISIRTNSVRLDGNAQITSSQLEVRADSIAFDFSGSQITQVRARGNVFIKVNMTPKGTGAAARIEANSEEADLNPPKRTLVLKGNVDGFYQVGNGPRTTLAGTQATIESVGNNQYAVTIKGPVRLIVPPETPATQGTAAIGSVTITSRDAEVDPKTNEVRFIGNARAISTDGPNKFDVTAPSFVLTRGADNTISTLRTSGRTLLKIDLPPEPAAATATAGGTTTVTTPTANTTTDTATSGNMGRLSKPTHVEVQSDTATVERATNTMTFQGNVIGFYTLAPAGAPPQQYNFSGTKATIKYIPEAQATVDNPAGMKADIIGDPNKPVQVDTPSFNVDF